MSDDEVLTGQTIIARALKTQGIDCVFGIVGIPVVELAQAFQTEGIRYIGMRNEQAASYAAGAYGYMTGRPGVCLVVSGPGVVHALAGLSNAWANCWPMILLGGANDTYQESTGAFQEIFQVEACRPYCKYATRPSSAKRFPFYIETAVRKSIYGRPGACYLDLPGDMLNAKVPSSQVEFVPTCPPPPRVLADPSSIVQALKLLNSAKNPLVIIGKGAGYGRAENSLKQFIETTGIPFLPTPLGKGVIDDNHPLNVGPARSQALGGADVILLVGARLNWILHFGKPPRFRPDVKIIQVDINAEELNTNVQNAVSLCGDVDSIVSQLNAGMKQHFPSKFSSSSEWWKALSAKIENNRRASEELYKEYELPMSYYRAFHEIKQLIPEDCIYVSEGANTMDIGRTIIMNKYPRSRLDAGTFGTMGVGLGMAIAAAVRHPDRRVICVEGDSAFGFSGMEVETACRYKLPIIFIIINNNGIYGGLDPDSWAGIVEEQPVDQLPIELPVSSLLPEARYERIVEAFGGKGYFCVTPEELSAALKDALASKTTCLINTMISPFSSRKPQEHGWLTRKDTSGNSKL